LADPSKEKIKPRCFGLFCLLSVCFFQRSEPLIGAGIMIPVSLTMGYLRLKDQPQSAIDDRAERISKNVGQQLCDKFAAYGGGFV
jgi:hypothetical protein